MNTLITLISLQEQRLQKLKDRLSVPFDETRPDHRVSIYIDYHFTSIEVECIYQFIICVNLNGMSFFLCRKHFKHSGTLRFRKQN